MPNQNFLSQPGTNIHKFRRGRTGIPAGIERRFRSELASTAFGAGGGAANQITRGLQRRGLSKSSAFLSAPQVGARVAGDISSRGNLAFDIENARLAEAGRRGDIQSGLSFADLIQRGMLDRRRIELEEKRFRSRPQFQLDTPVGGISF